MEDQLVEEYHVLVLGALKKCHVTSFHPMFEDYLQIARWVLVDAHRTFIKDGKSMDSFHNYVFQRIYWKITDEIEKNSPIKIDYRLVKMMSCLETYLIQDKKI